MNTAAARRYPVSIFATVLQIVTERYNHQELSVARLDAKYGQSKFTKNFFSDPERDMLGMLGNRHISNVAEMREMQSCWDDESEGFCCPVQFQDYLLEVVTTHFS